MKVSQLNITILLLLHLLYVTELTADSTYADQVFLDNATIYNEDTGVKMLPSSPADSQGARVYNDAQTELNTLDTQRVIYYDDPNLVPTVEQSTANEAVLTKTRNGFGFTFEQMAKSTQKSSTTSVKTAPKVKKKRSFGFSFSDMAKLTQKETTPNVSDD